MLVKKPILVLYAKCTRHRMNIVGQGDPLAYASDFLANDSISHSVFSTDKTDTLIASMFLG